MLSVERCVAFDMPGTGKRLCRHLGIEVSAGSLIIVDELTCRPNMNIFKHDALGRYLRRLPRIISAVFPCKLLLGNACRISALRRKAARVRHPSDSATHQRCTSALADTNIVQRH